MPLRSRRLIALVFLLSLFPAPEGAIAVGRGSTLLDLGLAYGANGMFFVLSVACFMEDSLATVFSLTGPFFPLGFRAGLNYYPPPLGHYGHLSLGISSLQDTYLSRQQVEKGGPVVTSVWALNIGIGANTPAFNFADTETNPNAYLPGQLYIEAGVSRILTLTRSKDDVRIPIEDGYLFKKAWFFPNIEIGGRFGDVD
jgi:hypothetical protein